MSMWANPLYEVHHLSDGEAWTCSKLGRALKASDLLGCPSGKKAFLHHYGISYTYAEQRNGLIGIPDKIVNISSKIARD